MLPVLEDESGNGSTSGCPDARTDTPAGSGASRRPSTSPAGTSSSTRPAPRDRVSGRPRRPDLQGGRRQALDPTPPGQFFVEESIPLRSFDVGAPFALALSARSNVLQEFDGGPGQIALHGLTNIGGVLGTAASHGCVRLADDAMRWLVARVGPGVPVTITN